MFEVTRLSKLLIMVSDKDDAYNAFSLGSDITLINSVSEGAGIKYFSKIVDDAASERKATKYNMVYDCSNSFKDALEALRMGAKVIKVTDDYKAYFKVIDMANKFGAKVVTKLDKKPMVLKKKDK